MGDISENITIRASGGDQSAAEIEKASKALNETAESSGRMQEKFQHRFQHIGLMMFAGDALRASGLGRETREVVGVLNMALMGASSAAGAASGGMFLLVGALSTLIGFVAKASEHHKDFYDEMVKTNKATHDQLKATQDSIDTIQKYEATIGNIPEYLRRWADSENTLKQAQVERQIEGDKAELMSLTLLMNTQAEHVERLREMIDDQQRLITVVQKSGAETAILNAQLEKQKKEYSDQSLLLKQQKANVDQLIASLKLLSSKGTDDLGHLTEANKKAQEAQDAMWKKYYADLKREDEKNMQETIRELELKERIARKYIDDVGNAFGQSIAKMIVEGKSFTETFKEMFKNMAEAVIADIGRMIVKWAIFSAMSHMAGPMGGVGAMGLSKMGFATGGEVMVDRPTLFMAGEGGPEKATFTPLANMGKNTGGGGSGGGGGGVRIGSISVSTVVNGVKDTDRIAREVGLKIVEQIRGAGQLDFVRT